MSKEIRMQEAGRAKMPLSVIMVGVALVSNILLLGMLFLWLFTVYFSGVLTSDKIRSFFGFHLLIAAALGFMLWMYRALSRRERAAWSIYTVLVGASVVWAVAAYLWLEKPLYRTSNALTLAHVINLLFWFGDDVREWFRVDSRRER